MEDREGKEMEDREAKEMEDSEEKEMADREEKEMADREEKDMEEREEKEMEDREAKDMEEREEKEKEDREWTIQKTAAGEILKDTVCTVLYSRFKNNTTTLQKNTARKTVRKTEIGEYSRKRKIGRQRTEERQGDRGGKRDSETWSQISEWFMLLPSKNPCSCEAFPNQSDSRQGFLLGGRGKGEKRKRGKGIKRKD